MNRTKLYIGIVTLLYTLASFSQSGENGIVLGRIFNSSTNEPIPFASLAIWGTSVGTVSDLDGNFTFTGLKPGYTQIAAQTVGFEDNLSEKFLVTNANKSFIEIPMIESQVEIAEVVVKASPFRKTEESPVSLQRIGIEQIEKNPGGNRDISKVIQSLPGVASGVSFRNDVVVRGGGPNENSFYLDGIEIPTINHFATQGSSGGPVGIINVDFIREVNFYSGAFPTNLGNSLSSVIDMRQIDGNKEKLNFKGSVGSSDLALTMDGPISENTTFIASVRRSYLQFLFSVLELPFLPTYNDFQFKSRTRINQKNELTIVALGAIDQFVLNLDANETPEQKYILSYLPVYEQWNYTVGGIFKHFRTNGYDSWIISRNYLNNTTYKHTDNNENLPKLLDYNSDELENKFRFEHLNLFKNKLKVIYGAGLVYSSYFNGTTKSIFTETETYVLEYETDFNLLQYNSFIQVSKPFLKNRLTLSAGLRADAANFSEEMSNPLKHISPRLSASYQITEKTAFNFNTGRYFQRPPYTALGYKDNNDVLVNKENNIKYLRSDQIVGGFSFQPNAESYFSLEGFYKNYSNYPFSVNDSIPLSSKGADFGTFGDEELMPIAEGRAYGFEILGRSQNLLGFNTILSYTYVRSEFKDLREGFEGNYIPSSWDNKHLLNITGTRKLKNNWYFGFKWRFVGGKPYTNYDLNKSEIKAAWDAQGGPYLDYSNFNKYSLKPFHQLDIRIDKEYFFSKWSLNIYLDIQNIYNFKGEDISNLIRRSFIEPEYNDVYTENGVEKYELVELYSAAGGTVLPSVGIIIKF